MNWKRTFIYISNKRNATPAQYINTTVVPTGLTSKNFFFPMREVFISSLAFPRSPAWKEVVGEACDWSRLRRPVQSIVWTNLQGQGYLWDVKNLEILATRVRLCLGCQNIGACTYPVQTYRVRAISGAKLVPTGASLCLIGKKRSICL